MTKQRKKASWGKDRLMYCRVCMVEQEVYSASGHPENKIWLHCVKCGNFCCTLIENAYGELEFGGLDK